MESAVIWGVDLAIAILLIEAIILWWMKRQQAHGLRLTTIVLIALSGIGLLLALRAALHGYDLSWVGIFLAIGGICHALDLRARLLANRAHKG